MLQCNFQVSRPIGVITHVRNLVSLSELILIKFLLYLLKEISPTNCALIQATTAFFLILSNFHFPRSYTVYKNLLCSYSHGM
jgi:hypothetical protein